RFPRERRPCCDLCRFCAPFHRPSLPSQGATTPQGTAIGYASRPRQATALWGDHSLVTRVVFRTSIPSLRRVVHQIGGTDSYPREESPRPSLGPCAGMLRSATDWHRHLSEGLPPTSRSVFDQRRTSLKDKLPQPLPRSGSATLPKRSSRDRQHRSDRRASGQK